MRLSLQAAYGPTAMMLQGAGGGQLSCLIDSEEEEDGDVSEVGEEELMENVLENAVSGNAC